MVINPISSQEVVIVKNFIDIANIRLKKYLDNSFLAATAKNFHRLWVRNFEFKSKSQIQQKTEKPEATEVFFETVRTCPKIHSNWQQ